MLHNANPEPAVSVILPIRNEAAHIAQSLGAILDQDYPHERMEVLVADGMSTDSTRRISLEVAARSDVPVIILDNPGRIVATGFNAALQRARGDIIVRVDGHTVIAADYVRQCVEALQRSGADNVGGRMDAASDGRIGRAIAAATSTAFGVGGARFHYSTREEWVDTVYLGSWPRSVFDRIGVFDEELTRNQDDEFNYRLLQHGGKILLTPRIRSRYFGRHTARGLCRQYFEYGFWKVRVAQKHPRQIRTRQLVPPLFVGSLIILAILALFSTPAAWLLAAVVWSYIVAVIAGSIAAARRGQWPLLPILPSIFAMLHVSYGLGFLVGLLRFRNRWRRLSPAAR